MPKRITVSPHLGLPQLEQRYKKAADPVERRHFQVLWQLAQGNNTQEVAASTGYTPYWIRRLVQRYNHDGPESMGDPRHNNPGAEPILCAEQRAALLAAVSAPAPDGSLWNSRTVAAWIEQTTGRKVLPQRGWVYLRRLGLTLQRPRPHNRKADPESPAASEAAQEQFKKNAR